MTRQEAVWFLVWLINERIGHGYHPDTPMCDYVMKGASGWDVPSFSRIEAEQLQAKHDAMLKVLGDNVYAICLTIMGGLQ